MREFAGEIDKSVLAEASMTAAYMTVTQGMYKYNNKTMDSVCKQ